MNFTFSISLDTAQLGVNDGMFSCQRALRFPRQVSVENRRLTIHPIVYAVMVVWWDKLRCPCPYVFYAVMVPCPYVFYAGMGPELLYQKI